MKIKFNKPVKMVRKAVDPPRFPKIIVKDETDFKSLFSIQLQKMTIDITKKLVEISKESE